MLEGYPSEVNLELDKTVGHIGPTVNARDPRENGILQAEASN